MPRKKKAQPTKIDPYTIVICRWNDAYFVGDISDPEKELDGGLMQETVGFLVKETPEFISIGHERSYGTNLWRGVTTVPRAYIKELSTFTVDITAGV